MGRKVNVFMHNQLAGTLEQTEEQFVFTYNEGYYGPSISISLPKAVSVHESDILHPYFEGLAPEGWLKKRYSEIQKIDEKDTFGFLIENGNDLLGAVTILPVD